jgi:hypothetical protein
MASGTVQLAVACLLLVAAAGVSAKKFKDCVKESVKTGVSVAECMGLAAPAVNQNGYPEQRPGYGAQTGGYVEPGSANSPPTTLLCDISAEPKRSGDWTFNACVIPPRANVQVGGQCACRSATTGLVYGGIVKGNANSGGSAPVKADSGYGNAGTQQPQACDVSGEPKIAGDWSLQSCQTRSGVAGTQCTCRSKTTGRIYGGVVR